MNTPQSESALQSQIVQWLRWSLPRDAVTSCFPSGGGGKVRGARLKQMGLKPGMPDLFIFYNGGAYGLEVKTAKGRASFDQKACHAELRFAGVKVEVVRSVAETEKALVAWGIRLKSRIAA